jgi:hypothetical protein
VFYDPVREFSVDVPLGDSGISVPTKFKPSERKETEFLELELDIAPVSMQDASPSQRLQTITNAVSNYLLPMAPMLQQQGVMFDAVAFNRQMAELTNTPELLELLVPVGSQPDPAGQAESRVGSAETRKKGSTGSSTRQYTPTGGTRAARDTVMAQAMLGMNPTPQQEQMMQRPGV